MNPDLQGWINKCIFPKLALDLRAIIAIEIIDIERADLEPKPYS
jgi:hypothetical protein